MKKYKNILSLAAITITTLLLLTILKQINKNEKDIITIGIIQTISHPALDNIRTGYIKYLTTKLRNKIKFIYQNAEGSISNAHNIAKSYHVNASINGILAIGTQAAQAIANIEKEKPIFISAVTDPNNSGLLQNNQNVCGTTDMIDIKKEIKLLKQLPPNAQTVSILYNPSETNSLSMVKTMVSELKRNNLTPIKIGVNSEAEITQSTKLAIRKSDTILVPTDNLIVAAMPQVATIAINNKTPLIVSDNPSVTRGALASRGVDYLNAGKQTAKITLAVLNGQKPETILVQEPAEYITIINENTLNKLGIKIPEELSGKIKLIKK